MIDTLQLVTEVSSLIAFVLIAVAVVICIIAFKKFTGESKFKNSILFFTIFLILFMLAVLSMSIYHWFDFDLMEDLWYITLTISLILGIISSVYSLSFWQKIEFKKKKRKH